MQFIGGQKLPLNPLYILCTDVCTYVLPSPNSDALRGLVSRDLCPMLHVEEKKMKNEKRLPRAYVKNPLSGDIRRRGIT